jgi:hypothetical protein
MTWYPSANVDAQTCHFFVAMWAMAQFRDWKFRLASAFAAVLGFALFKEFVLDLFVVEHDTVGGSGVDFLFYALGMVVGYWLQRATGGWDERPPAD